AEVAALIIEGGRVKGVSLMDGRDVRCEAVIITTGTFLNGLAHIGEQRFSCGRNGEPPSQVLAGQVRGLGLGWTRLKTGTPPRLDARSIDWSRFERQFGDTDPVPFSFLTAKIDRPQIQCYLARTTAETKRIMQESIARWPLYREDIRG